MFVVAGRLGSKVWLRYCIPEDQAVCIVDRKREAVRFDLEKAEYLARYMGPGWRVEHA